MAQLAGKAVVAVDQPAAGDEYIKLTNLTTATVKLYDPDFPANVWRIDELLFAFPPGIELAPLASLLVVQALRGWRATDEPRW